MLNGPSTRARSTGPPIQVMRARSCERAPPGVLGQALELGEQFGGDALTRGQQARAPSRRRRRRPPRMRSPAPRPCDVPRRRPSTGPRAPAPHEPARHRPATAASTSTCSPIQMTQAATRRRAGGVAPALARVGVEPARLQARPAGPARPVQQFAQRGLPRCARACVSSAARRSASAFRLRAGVLDHGLVHARPRLGSRPRTMSRRLRPRPRRGCGGYAIPARAPPGAAAPSVWASSEAFDVVHESIPSALRTVRARSGGAPRPRTSGTIGDQRRDARSERALEFGGRHVVDQRAIEQQDQSAPLGDAPVATRRRVARRTARASRRRRAGSRPPSPRRRCRRRAPRQPSRFRIRIETIRP